MDLSSVAAFITQHELDHSLHIANNDNPPLNDYNQLEDTQHTMPSIDPSLREEEYNAADPYLNLQPNNNPIRKEDLYAHIQQGIDEAVCSAAAPKCNRRGFKVKGAQLVMCSAIDCTKVIHPMCYHVENSNKNVELLPPLVIVCTKKCHQKYIR